MYSKTKFCESPPKNLEKKTPEKLDIFGAGGSYMTSKSKYRFLDKICSIGKAIRLLILRVLVLYFFRLIMEHILSAPLFLYPTFCLPMFLT